MCQKVCLGTWDPTMDPSVDCEVPPSDQACTAGAALREGFLLKMVGRGWLFTTTWKKRFCVLTRSALYFYEKEHSTGRDKSCGALNLHYFDVCEEDPKKPLTFVMDSSVKAFFDNRHQFCCDTPEDAEGWISSIRKAIAEVAVRRSRRNQNQQVVALSSLPRTPDRLVGALKDRVKGPQGRRPPHRKSLMPTSKSDDLDLDVVRQRSVSLSGPQRSIEGKELPTVNEGGKWLSLSMEEVEVEGGPQGGEEGGPQRSSSAADIPRRDGVDDDDDEEREEAMRRKRRGMPPRGNLLFQHAAFTKELETRLKAHNTQLLAKQDEDEQSLEQQQQHQTEDQVKKVLLQVKTALQEVSDLRSEYRHALEDARMARREFQNLQHECRELIDTLKKQQKL